MENEMKKDLKYSTIQIRTDVKDHLVVYCREYGYKISGLVEKLIISHISGSIYQGKSL